MKNELQLKINVFESIKHGATIFGDLDAQLICMYEKEYIGCINILTIQQLKNMNVEIHDNGKLAYLGAILTGKGKKQLAIFKRAIKLF